VHEDVVPHPHAPGCWTCGGTIKQSTVSVQHTLAETATMMEADQATLALLAAGLAAIKRAADMYTAGMAVVP
jgi:hypothetical protein